MIKYITLFLFVFLIGRNAVCQSNVEKPFRNSFNVEIFGNSLTLLSFHYERFFKSNKNKFLKYSGRTGFGLTKSIFDLKPLYSIPIEFNMILGKKRHFLDIGVGTTLYIGTSNLNDTLIPQGFKTNFTNYYTFRIGYRLAGLPDNEHAVFRIAPLIVLGRQIPQEPKLSIYYTFGVSLGFMF
jgi:hypothetical protein